MSKQREHPFEERLRRVEKALEQKANLKDVEENGSGDLASKLELLEFKVEDLDDLYSQLEELKGM